MTTKYIAVKFVGSPRAKETLAIVPGTTCADVLETLNLKPGYYLSDAQNPDHVYRPTDNLYALVEDGTLLFASAIL